MTPETKDWIDLLSKLIIAVAAIYGAYRSNRNSKAIETVRQDVNGKMGELLKVTGEAEHAKGMKEEKDNPS